jgi:FkbM family methyltransferase
MSIATATHALLQRAGYDIHHYRPAADRRYALLTELGIRTVVDVGANTGQYGAELRRSGYAGHIVSIEPLSDAYPVLLRNTAGDPRWTCFNVAASDRAGTATIHVAGNSASSSLLPMAAALLDVAPYTAVVATGEVALARLDQIAGLADLPAPFFLKLDVQGHELTALAGATGLLDQVAGLEVELSVRELYLGAPVLPESIARIAAMGFRLHALEPGFTDPRDGTILQFDGILVRI